MYRTIPVPCYDNFEIALEKEGFILCLVGSCFVSTYLSVRCVSILFYCISVLSLTMLVMFLKKWFLIM